MVLFHLKYELVVDIGMNDKNMAEKLRIEVTMTQMCVCMDDGLAHLCLKKQASRANSVVLMGMKPQNESC